MAELLNGLGSSLGGGFSGLGSVIQYVLIIGIIGGLAWLVWFFMSYKVAVEIKYPRTWGRPITLDKGRFVKDKRDKSIERFVLLKNKEWWKGPLSKEYIQPVKAFMGRTKDKVEMLMDEDGQLVVVLPPTEKLLNGVDGKVVASGGVKAVDREWALNEVAHSIEKYTETSWFDRYGQQLLTGVTLMAVFVMFLVIIRELGPLAEAFRSAANAFAQAQAAGQVVS